MLLAVDPGTSFSAYVLMSHVGRSISEFGISPNEDLLRYIGRQAYRLRTIAIERIASYGMPVGAETFETVFWSGRFAQVTQSLSLSEQGVNVVRPTRKEVVTHLCGSVRAKDGNVRQAIIDRYGGEATTKKGGPLYGISKDVWAALAVALYVIDRGEA